MIDYPNVKIGDFFCSANIAGEDTFLSRHITRVERWWSKDNEAIYGHSGIIINSDGTTMEALLTIKRQNIYKDYLGTRVLIGRHIGMNKLRFEKAYAAIRNYEGKWYPGWRLAFFLFCPPLAKYIHYSGMPVCSEFAGFFGNIADLEEFKTYWGLNPDDLADMIRKWDCFNIVYEGII